MIRRISRLHSISPALRGYAGPGVLSLILFLLVQTPARVHGEESLDKILDQWTEALGGRERLEKIQTIHSLWSVEMVGMQGTAEDWLSTEGFRRFDLDLAGIIHIAMVKTPENCWYMDQNGKVRERGGKELEDEVRDIYLNSWSHLLDAGEAGAAECLGLDPGTDNLRIRILPPGGTESTYWIDKKTYLPARSESPGESGETTVTTFTEWRTVEDIVIPSHIVETSATPRDRTVMQLKEVYFNETPPPGIFNKPKEKAEDVRFDSGTAALNIPLDLDGVHLFLNVQINDSKPLSFVLDSGAEITCVDRQLADDLGLEFAGELAGEGVGEEKVDVSFVRNVSFRVPGAELVGQTVVAAALRDILEARLGRALDGILGYDFISRFVVEIDYLNGTLHLHDRQNWEYSGTGTRVPIQIVDNIPVCDASITMPDGRSLSGNFYLDTGSGTDLRLNKPFTDSHDLLSAMPEKAEFTGGFGIGGETKDYLGRIASVTIGDLRFRGPICSFSQDARGVGADISKAGKFGGGLFERCTMILDYERNRVIFEPNQNFDGPFHGDMSGLTFDTGGREDWHTFTVRHVMKGSPADGAGIEVGDIIVSVDGISADELMKSEVTALFREEGRSISLGLEREGQIHHTEMCMEPML